MSKKPAGKANVPAKVSTKPNLPTKGEDEFYSGTSLPRGSENVTAADKLTPRITILEPLAPQLNKSNEKYIKGAKAGQFCDVEGRLVWDDQISLVCCHYARQHIEWSPRENRAKGRTTGFIKNHGSNPAILEKTTRNDKFENVLPNGNIIDEAMTFFCLNLMDNGTECFVALSRTRTKAGKLWLKLMQSIQIKHSNGTLFTPDYYYMVYNCMPKEISNDRGQWYTWDIEASGKNLLQFDPSRQLLEHAKAFNRAAQIGLGSGEYDASIAASMADQEHQATGDNEGQRM